MRLKQKNNFQRVVAAARVVYGYMRVNGRDRSCISCGTEQTMIALVTDLRHMAEATEVEFDAVLTASLDLYEAEAW